MGANQVDAEDHLAHSSVVLVKVLYLKSFLCCFDWLQACCSSSYGKFSQRPKP